MKAVHVIILILLIVSVYLMFPQQISVKKSLVPTTTTTTTVNDEVPVTWNLDWDGGPGYDRYRIMNEQGPWNPNGT